MFKARIHNEWRAKAIQAQVLLTSESSREEEELDHIEVASKHNNHSDIGENSTQKMAEFEKCLEAMGNRGKL